MSTCPTREQFLRHLTGRGSPDDEHLIAEHVRSCEACREALSQLTAADRPTEGRPPPPPPAGTGRRATTPEGPRAVIPDPGDFVGRYEVLDELAAGGMGVVYEADDRLMGRHVALKMIRSGVLADAEEVERFTREVRALAQLSHPHVMQVYDFGEGDGRPYFTMQLAAGGSLAEHLPRFGADARAAAALVEKVARGVQHAHDRGILHRDLKPANVLLGEGDEPLVSDFGLVKFVHVEAEGLTQAGQTPGTPAYMAPEQAAGRGDQVGPRTDVWALGVILYELVTGRRPFTGQSREETLHHILTTPVLPPRSHRPEIDPALEGVVLKCLEKEPDRRYQSAGELAADLGRWLRGELKPTPKPAQAGRLARLGQGVRRHPQKTAAVIGAAAILALGAGLYVANALQPGSQGPKELDPPITLVGDSGPPKEFNWIRGADTVTVGPMDEGFSFRTKTTAVAQLLAEPPWESYRVEADVRHDATEAGTAGVFFGYTGSLSARGPCHVFCTAGLADRGRLRGQVCMSLWRLPDAPSNPYGHVSLFRDYPFLGPVPAGAPSPWVPLAVEITPKEVKVFCADRLVRTLSAAEIGQQGTNLVNHPNGINWESVPRGGIGVFIEDGGAATFRQVVVRPLKQRP